MSVFGQTKVVNRFIRVAAFSISVMLTMAVPGVAATARWWNPHWPYRACIECPAGEGDVGYVTLTLAGRTTATGWDLRLVDAEERLRPFEILHHDPQLTTLIRFLVPDGKPRTVWLYYGNTQAHRIDTRRLHGARRKKASQVHADWKKSQAEREKLLEQREAMRQQLAKLKRMEEAGRAAGNVPPQVTANLRQSIKQLQKQLDAIRIPDETPEPEDPTQWYPRRGVVLQVYRKARKFHPKSLVDLRRLVKQSTLEGAGVRQRMSDGFNPFGTSDHYISVYEGYLRIDEPGYYAFCSSSDDGSWIMVNGRGLLKWPGPHGWEGSARGEKYGRIVLKKGIAQVRYYHEEGEEGQLAFLGWKPPSAQHFTAIPDNKWLNLREAKVAFYESHKKPIMAIPEVRVLHTYWVRDTDAQQVTMVACRDVSQSRNGLIRHVQWSFGDGLEAKGREVRHAFFRLGRPEVTLSVRDAQGNEDNITCSPNIFHVDVRASGIRYGKAEAYIKAAEGYDTDRMRREDLESYAQFWRQLERWPQYTRAAESFLRRFPDAPSLRRVAGEVADAYMRPQAYKPQRADELLQQVLSGTHDSNERVELSLQRVRLLAWDLSDYEQAAVLLSDVCETRRSGELEESNRLTRQCLIASGDVAMLLGMYERAEQLYRPAQEMGGKIDQAEELAKTGSYPYSVEDFLARGEFKWALKTIDKWEDQFPVQKLEGYTFFLRGKVLFVEQPSRLALRYLDLAETVSPRAVHVPEAVWLRANCLMAIGQFDKALDEFRRILVDFTQSEFFELAGGKIEQCEAELQESAGNAKRR